MKIHVAGFWQETNSFNPNPTTLDHFKRGYVLRADDIRRELSGTNTEIGGFIRFQEEHPEVNMHFGFAAWAAPAGPIQKQTFESIQSHLQNHLREDDPDEGVLLSLHGALVDEEGRDCEGELLSALRRRLGATVPIVSSLDWHAAVSDQMLESADILVGYRTYPHIDYSTTGKRAAVALQKLLRENQKIHRYFRRLPLILPVENTESGNGPLSPVMEALRELDRDRDIIASSLFIPHPWLDVAEQGPALLVYSMNEIGKPEMARFDAILKTILDRRSEFYLEFPGVEEFAARFNRCAKPAIAVDLGDITSAGGCGDSTVFLRSILETKFTFSAALPLVDPQAVDRAFQLGKGNRGNFEIGSGEAGDYHQRVHTEAEVLNLSNEKVKIVGASLSGMKTDPGRRALIRVGTGILVTLCEHSSMMHDPEFYRSMGVEPGRQDLIVQKSHKLFRAAYQGVAQSIVEVDTPGRTDRNIRRLPYRRVKRPIYPLDEIDSEMGRLFG